MIQPGTTLGPYKIADQIGAGGMGEVYRALDTRLDRTVAIKVLPEEMAADPGRRERFEREARAVSSLNHPHICTLYDVGEQDGTHFLVMELVEGQTLEQQLSKGRLPLEQALQYAIEIADALDKAHRQGVVHRDLKPGNIMITPSGVKLLDFGLAKLKGEEDIVSPMSRVLTAGTQPLTAEGAILGTLQYMSPEQLEGKQADPRTDIFAFGAVLYEMLTGRRAFAGESQASLIGAIMNSDPQPMGELDEMPARSVDHLVRRCLEKDRDDRWQTTADLMRELQWLLELREHTGTSSVGSVEPGRARVSWFMGALVVVLLALLIVALIQTPDGSEAGSVAFSIFPPEGTVFGGGRAPVVPSPDGTQIVAVATAADGTPSLWLRLLAEDVFRPIPGTEGASSPFWSPESDWIGFYTKGALRRVRPSGRDLATLATVSTGRLVGQRDAAWGAGQVLFKPGRFEAPYRVIPVEGGASRIAVPIGDTNGIQVNAHFLADGYRFLFEGSGEGQRMVYLASLDGATGVLPVLMREANYRPLAYVPGYLLLVEENTLYAMAFDKDTSGNLGERRRVVEGIPVMGGGAAPFSVSSNVLVYSESVAGNDSALRWFDRDGTPGTVIAENARFDGFDVAQDSSVAFSRVRADGSRDVFRALPGQSGDITVTTDGDSSVPVWSSNGDRIAFASARQAAPFLHTETLATAEEEPWQTDDLMTFPYGWGPNDDVIVYSAIDRDGRSDIGFFHVDEERHERFSRNTAEFNESFGTISPDGEWMAWVTDDSGEPQVWVAPYPSLDEPQFVADGDFPAWRPEGGELYFVSDGLLMARAVAGNESALELGAREEVLNLARLGVVWDSVNPAAPYAPSSDGQRFLLHVRSDQAEAPPVKVIVNWTRLIEDE